MDEVVSTALRLLSEGREDVSYRLVHLWSTCTAVLGRGFGNHGRLPFLGDWEACD
jgi:hypothetical protein